MSQIPTDYTLVDSGSTDVDYDFVNDPPRSRWVFDVRNATGAVSLEFYQSIDGGTTFVPLRVTDRETLTTITSVGGITQGLYDSNIEGRRNIRVRKLGVPSNVSCDISGHRFDPYCNSQIVS